MEDAGLSPNAATYNAFVRACVEGRGGGTAGKPDMDGAREVVREMRARGVRPTEATLSLLVRGYLSAGDAAGARSAVQGMGMGVTGGADGGGADGRAADCRLHERMRRFLDVLLPV
jgi:hypothetical protein